MEQVKKRSKRGGYKPRGFRFKPQEGLYVKYRLALRGLTLEEFGRRNGVKGMTVTAVLKGRNASSRLTAAMVRELGYPSLSDLLEDARVSGEAGKGGEHGQ